MSMVTPEQQDAVQATLSDLDATLVSIRRDIHAHPELSWHEARTLSLIHI